MDIEWEADCVYAGTTPEIHFRENRMSNYLSRCVLGIATLLSIGSAPRAKAAAADRYSGDRVVRVTVINAAQRDQVVEWARDVWSCNGAGIGTFDVQVSPENFDALARSGIAYETLIDDVQALLDADAASRSSSNGGDWFSSYKTYAEINDRIALLTQVYPDLATASSVGQSLEGRDLTALRITGPNTESNLADSRPVVFIGATQHAREWIAPMTAMFLAQQLLDLYAVDPRVQYIVDSIDFRIVALDNPDGYEYTWTTNRLWRKNREINQGSSCRGVDMNRNWGYAWGGQGSSSDPCSDVYRGTDPWSEPETAALRDFVLSFSDRLLVTWDLHSYSQLVLEPWQYTTQPPPDSTYLNELGSLIAQAIADIHGVRYEAGEGSRILYLAAGTAHDWAYGELGAWGIGIELRDTGRFGFVLPPDQIIPTGEEIFESLLRLNERLLSGG